MRDERLLELVSHAVQAEALERSAHDIDKAPETIPMIRVRVEPLRQAKWFKPLAAGLAAAAAIAVGVFWPSGSPQPVTPAPVAPGPVATTTDVAPAVEHAPEVRLARSERGEGSAAVLLAVFRQADSRCDCVVWEPDAFGGQTIDELDASELIEAAWRHRCAETGDLMLVMALDGPRELLPRSAEEAIALAACLSAEECGPVPACYETHAPSCLAPGVALIAETISLAR
jgi:hypothetical protein